MPGKYPEEFYILRLGRIVCRKKAADVMKGLLKMLTLDVSSATRKLPPCG
jgi:hypothetical protein